MRYIKSCKNYFLEMITKMSPGVWEYTEDGEYSISLEVPYGIEDFETFYEAGIRAILKEKFGEDNYTIIV